MDEKEAEQNRLRRQAEQTWYEGYDACREGKQRFRNPYRLSSEDDKALKRETLG